MSKWIPLFALAVLAVVGAFLLTRSTPQGDKGVNPGLESERNGGDPEAPVVIQPRSTDQNRPDTATGPVGPTEVGARGILGPKIQAAIAAGEFVVVAIDPRSKKPIEGMRVWLLDRDQLALGEWQRLGSDAANMRKEMKARGTERVTNSEGGASFAGVLNGALLAEGEGWTASADWIGPLESPYVLKLLPLKELTVRVVNKNGDAQRDVPVWIGPVAENRWVPMIQRSTPSSGEIGFDGVARLGGRADKSALGAFLGFPHSPKMFREIDPKNLPEEVIELPMVPSRPLIIHVVDDNGEPRTESAQVEIGVEPVRDAGFQSIVTRRLRNGTVEFPFVGLGTRLRIRLSGVTELQTKEVDLGTISAGGDTPEHTIAWHELRTIFVGIARNGETGEVLAETSLRVTWSDGKDSRSTPLRTDELGNFRLVTQGPLARSVKLEAPQTENRPKLVANPRIPVPPPSGEYPLGTVDLMGEPLFAMGRVVDSLGVPISGAHVRVESQQQGAPGGGKGGARGSKGPQIGSADLPGDKPAKGNGDRGSDERGGMQQHWAPIPGLSGVTNEYGEFQIYGRGHSPNMRFFVQRRGFAPLRMEHVKAGAAPYELVMSGSVADVDSADKGAKDRADKEESRDSR